MGKRSSYERKPRDFYPTPIEAVKPLSPFLPLTFSFVEPCAGNGALISHLETLSGGECSFACDIEPMCEDVETLDAFELAESHVKHADLIITNPPWDRKILHPLITHLCALKPTWLLFDADWMHTQQSAELVKSHLQTIISIGRVKWFPESAGTSKDNCCWYLFVLEKTGETTFKGRVK
jgi:hypothetical protein